MRKISLIIFLLLIFFLININECCASNSITYYYGETIKLDNTNIEIISNEVTINTTTSQINTIVLLENTTNEDIITSIAMPLENKEITAAINNLSITINEMKVNYTKDDKGDYIIKTKIPANSGKKLEINYDTDNNLQNAKIIKYNLQNFEKRTIGKVKVNIIIDEKNIPLIEGIYPGHFTFQNNTISVEYYNYKVNSITKEIIVQKETFHNLLYGRETQLDNEEREFIQNWFENTTLVNTLSSEKQEVNKICLNIIDYINVKNDITVYNTSYSLGRYKNPIIYTMSVANLDSKKADLKGKMICIDFVETEGNKDLYVYKTVGYETRTIQYDEGEYTDEYPIKEYVLMPERDILKTDVSQLCNAGTRGARVIYAGEGINGEDLNATEEEIIEYVNSINADMYIRIMIYDGKISYTEQIVNGRQFKRRIGDGLVGYYNSSNYEIAKAFAFNGKNLMTEEVYNRYDDTDRIHIFYSNYEEYSKNYYNDYYNDTLIKLSNAYVSNHSEIPTVAQFIGNRVYEDGKYIVNFFEFYGFYNSLDRGLVTANNALNTSQAQKLLTTNKEKNARKKANIENRILNLEILDNEDIIQAEFEPKNETVNNTMQLNDGNYPNLSKKDLIVFYGIGLAILVCIIILIIERRKKKI